MSGFAVTICIATFGDEHWKRLAWNHAAPSAFDQGVGVVLVHGDSLAGARNAAAKIASTEWLIFLDADDQLAPGYVDAMAQANGDLRAPALFEDGCRVDLTRRNIEDLNPCVVGTAVRKDLLAECGGWPDFPIYEDWALWLRASRRGAKIEHVPDAHYLARTRPGSRNTSLPPLRAARVAREIRAWA